MTLESRKYHHSTQNQKLHQTVSKSNYVFILPLSELALEKKIATKIP